MAYRQTAIYSFPRAVLETSVLGLTFLPVARFAPCLLPNSSYCSLLKAARPEWLNEKVRAGPGLSSSSSFGWCGKKLREWAMLLHPRLLLRVQILFSFRRRRPLHNVQSLTLHSVMEVPTACFATSNSSVFLKTPLNVLSFLGRSCFFKPRCLIPLMPPGLSRRLFPSVRPFWILGTALFLTCS
jgi:hypothetical protein